MTSIQLRFFHNSRMSTYLSYGTSAFFLKSEYQILHKLIKSSSNICSFSTFKQVQQSVNNSSCGPKVIVLALERRLLTSSILSCGKTIQPLSSLLIHVRKTEIPAMQISQPFHVLDEFLHSQPNTKRAAGLRMKLESRIASLVFSNNNSWPHPQTSKH